jgi:peptidoglycan/xylan/chitin deacetylase (PgdA/CDA1 family)
MRSLGALALLVAIAASGTAAADECNNPNALGVSRTMTVDPAALPLIGTMSYHDTLPLADHEVVLTFDDGPLPPHTGAILDILASECVKATYFMVGRMATAFPEWVRKVAAAGHTVGTHSQSHPLTFHKMPLPKAEQEIDQGFESVQAALGGDVKVAPFFRYPGLLHQANSEEYLHTRGIMAWSADIPGDDWRRVKPKDIIQRSISRLETRGRGVLLLHDIHKKTVLALPGLLAELKAKGFKVVHVVPGSGDPALIASVGVPAAVADPNRAAGPGTTPVAETAAGQATQQKTLAVLPDHVPIPPVRAKAAAEDSRAQHDRSRASARASHRPAHAARTRPATRHAQPQQWYNPWGQTRQQRVKRAHVASPHSG